MAKINQEEYEVLKELDDKWKWIARDNNYDASLFCFEDKPYKSTKIGAWGPTVVQYEYLGRHDSKFQFIKWEDGEPYSIQELIDEYLDDEYGYFNMKLSREFEEFIKKESEEAEVKKDIEWMEREIPNLRGYAVIIDGEGGERKPVTTVSVEDIYEIINQLDEPEVKQLDRKMKELESFNDELIRDNNQFRNELDNQEVLSEEWIERNTSPVDDEGRLYVWKRDLQNAIVPKQEITEEQVTEYLRERSMTAVDSALVYKENLDNKVVIEKPTIPEFVAEFLDGKEEYALYELLDNDFIHDNHDKLARWLYDNDEKTNKKRERSLVLAYRYGYEVEMEQRYYVMNNDNRMMLVRMMDGKTITEADPFKLEDMYEAEKKSHRLTEQEIKDYDPRYWAFRKPVEELE